MSARARRGGNAREPTEGSYEAPVDLTRPPEAVFDALTTERGLRDYVETGTGRPLA